VGDAGILSNFFVIENLIELQKKWLWKEKKLVR
jgi:hypothetical protein